MARNLAPLAWLIVIFLSVAAAVVLVVSLFLVLTPDGSDLKGCVKTTMFEVDLCPRSKTYTPLGQISPVLRQAVIVSEDSGFWDHHGIDWNELKASFETNLKQGRFARGGSTLTQQLAKNVYLSGEKSVIRKIREAIIALRIERLYSKEFILEKYLNVVQFGKDVYGVKAASQYYFNKTPSDLTIAQSAWLAFLLPNPEKYSVSFHKAKLTPFAKRQMRVIVDRLARFKRISESERQTASSEVARLFGDQGDDTALEMTVENSPDWDGTTDEEPISVTAPDPNPEPTPEASEPQSETPND